ncbi:MAG: hypothetical protein J6O60_08855 [Lachnospiraceae bacterium]|nr:hypothetical protein [Lachnospiraceae bacterium]
MRPESNVDSGLFAFLRKTFNFVHGNNPAGKYYGFYYSPNDIPQSYQCEKKVVTNGDDSWKWTGGGDDGGITKKICDKWYYFEAWF